MVLFMRNGLQANEWMGYARRAVAAHENFIHAQTLRGTELASLSMPTAITTAHKPTKHTCIYKLILRTLPIYKQ